MSSRREFLARTANGFGALAALSLNALSAKGATRAPPLAKAA